MKCPKCGYLGFEDVERCRNCGYDFSLRSAAVLPELPLRGEHDTLSPPDDLALMDAAAAAALADASEPSGSKGERDQRTSPSPSRFPTGELPLFGSTTAESVPLPDDAPLITRTSPPRVPLAVRRATPEVPRLRPSARRRTPMLDLSAFDAEPEDAASGRRRNPETVRQANESWTDSPTESAAEPAGVGARVGAAVVDLLILAAIDAVVVYLTMQICGVTVEDLRILPKGPLIAFLAAENLGYFIGFTIGGQTLGKMAAGIKVVSARDNASLDFGHSVVRTLVWVALAVPAGLGFLTALFGHEYRGLHDRCAGTKVVRAST